MCFAEPTWKDCSHFHDNKAGGTSDSILGIIHFSTRSACTNSISKFEKFAFAFARRHSRSRQIPPCRPLTIYLICGGYTSKSAHPLLRDLFDCRNAEISAARANREARNALAGESRGKTAFSLSADTFPSTQPSVTGVSCRSLSFSLKERKQPPGDASALQQQQLYIWKEEETNKRDLNNTLGVYIKIKIYTRSQFTKYGT